MTTSVDGKIDKAQVAGVTINVIFDREYIMGGYRFIIGHFYIEYIVHVYGVTLTVLSLGELLLRAPSKKQCSEAPSHTYIILIKVHIEISM